MLMKRCVSYKGQFVSDGKDPLRAGSDHYADSIGGANQFLGGFLFFGRLEIRDPRPDRMPRKQCNLPVKVRCGELTVHPASEDPVLRGDSQG